MKKLSTQLSLILVILFTGSVLAQEPGITWTKLYKPTCTGCIAAAEATDGVQLPDGGYLAAGWTMHPLVEPYLVRTNSSGDTLWTRCYSNELTGFTPIPSVHVEIANDGNYFLSAGGLGEPGQGVGLLKISTNGDLISKHYFTEGAYDTIYMACDMKVTPDGGVIITGNITPGITIERYAFLLKFTADGTFDWYRKFGNNTTVTMGWTVENALDGGYVVCCSYDTIGFDQLMLLKTDNTGQKQWSVVYPIDTPHDIDDYPCILRTNDNNYIISAESAGDYFLMKADPSGSMIWFHTYGFDTYEQQPYCMAQTTDGGYIITGYDDIGANDNKIYVVKTNSNGEEEWSKEIDVYFYEETYKIHQTLDNGYLLYGKTRTDIDGMDYLMMLKLGGASAIEDQETNNNSAQIRNYPNPFTSNTTIEYCLPEGCQVSLKVYDVSGTEVMTLIDDKRSAGKHEVSIDPQDLPAGIYFYRLKAGEINSCGKMFVIK